MKRCRQIGVSLALAALLAVASGCGNSADPDTWEEAELQGDKVRENFMNACLQANESSPTNPMTEANAIRLCECSFEGLRNALNFDEFKDLDKALRSTPNPSDLDDDEGETTEFNWDNKAEQIIENCIPRSAS